MAPVTRSQAAKATVFAPQNDGNRVQKSISQKTTIKKTILTPRNSEQFSDLQKEIVDRALEQSISQLRRQYTNRIQTGMSKDELLEHIESALQARRAGELNVEKKLRRIRRVLEAAARQTSSTVPVTFRDDFIERLTYGIYDSLKSTHRAPNGCGSRNSRARIEACFGAVTESSTVVQATARSVSTAEAKEDDMSDSTTIVNSPPQLISNERERVARLEFSPKCSKDEAVEFALLEILSTLGRDSLDEPSYDDFVIVVQIVKQE